MAGHRRTGMQECFSESWRRRSESNLRSNTGHGRDIPQWTGGRLTSLAGPVGFGAVRSCRVGSAGGVGLAGGSRDLCLSPPRVNCREGMICELTGLEACLDGAHLAIHLCLAPTLDQLVQVGEPTALAGAPTSEHLSRRRRSHLLDAHQTLLPDGLTGKTCRRCLEDAVRALRTEPIFGATK